ncbi:MAG: aminotransferase class V-fold PLP-dependent enzyme [Rivularia sp. (in: cyanobacteria)]
MATDYHDQFAQYNESTKYIYSAMTAIKDYEEKLSWHLISGLQAIKGIKVHGITQAEQMHHRVPTVCFTHQNYASEEIAALLAEKNIFVWSGDFYALEIVKRLGLDNNGGLVRVGAAHYNTIEEIDIFLEALANL